MIILKRKYWFLLILLLLEMIFIDDIFAYTLFDTDFQLKHLKGKNDSNIKQICAYSEDGFYNLQKKLQLLIIYDDNSAYHNDIYYASSGNVTGNHYINNWNKNHKWDSYIDKIDSLSNEAKGQYINTGQCPDVFFYRGCLSEHYFLGYDKNLSGSNTWDKIYKELEKGLCTSEYFKLIKDDSYDGEDLLKCEYKDFTISYSNKDGIVRKIDVKKRKEYGQFNKFSISNSYKDNYSLLKYKKCPVIFSCLEDEDYDTGTLTYYYSLYVDELVAEKEYKGCSNNRLKCISGEYCDPNFEGICPSYIELSNQLNEKNIEYKKTNDSAVFQEIKNLENSIKTLCKNIVSNSDHNSNCLSYCLNFKNGWNEKLNTNVNCGFSGRIAIWIGNIIRWVKYIIPSVVIIFGILDFIKALGADKEDEMKKAQKKFIRRLIAAALIFIVPFIIEFILDKMGFSSNGCGIIDL